MTVIWKIWSKLLRAGDKKRFSGPTLNFHRTYLCNETWHQQSEKNLSIYRDSPIHTPNLVNVSPETAEKKYRIFCKASTTTKGHLYEIFTSRWFLAEKIGSPLAYFIDYVPVVFSRQLDRGWKSSTLSAIFAHPLNFHIGRHCQPYLPHGRYIRDIAGKLWHVLCSAWHVLTVQNRMLGSLKLGFLNFFWAGGGTSKWRVRSSLMSCSVSYLV